MHLNVYRLRQVTRPLAFRVFYWGSLAAIVSVVFSMVATGGGRILGVRAIGICFAAMVSGFLVHYLFIAADEWRKRDYFTSAWMLLWTAIMSLIIYIGIRVAIFGYK